MSGGERAAFEQRVLELVRSHIQPFDEPRLGTQMFHGARLEGSYPDAQVEIEYSFTDDPVRRVERYGIWAPEFSMEADPDGIAVLIYAYVCGG